MEPFTKKTGGRQLGNAAAAGEICGVTWETYQWYIRTGRPANNPPPKHVSVDTESGQRLYPLKAVRAWHLARTGRGNWGGDGARAREKYLHGPDAAVDEHGSPRTTDTVEEAGARAADTTDESAHV
jgi:hypothetical protein